MFRKLLVFSLAVFMAISAIMAVYEAERGNVLVSALWFVGVVFGLGIHTILLYFLGWYQGQNDDST